MPEDYPKPAVTVDIVVFTVIKNKLKVLLIQRGQAPFAGFWCLPGGFVRVDESVDDAAARELAEETGIKAHYLEQLYTFGAPKRDPRGRVITVAYFALVDSTNIIPVVTGEENISAVEWFDVSKLPKLGFDHKEIIAYALKRLRYKLEYTAVGFELLPDLFTLTELENLYEIILGEQLDKRNFRKKIFSMGLVEITERYKKGAHRPARLYRFKKAGSSSRFKRIVFEG